MQSDPNHSKHTLVAQEINAFAAQIRLQLDATKVQQVVMIYKSTMYVVFGQNCDRYILRNFYTLHRGFAIPLRQKSILCTNLR